MIACKMITFLDWREGFIVTQISNGQKAACIFILVYGVDGGRGGPGYESQQRIAAKTDSQQAL